MDKEERCIGWVKGCKCTNCLKLHDILVDPRISSKEERDNANRRLWTKKPEDRRKK